MLTDISDTALWIAAIRAQETARPDAIFRDPLAAKLAGTRGPEIMSVMPHPEAMAFAMAIRTVAIDRLVLETVPLGIDTVINIGAGMDTRPYRLPLPRQLCWIEIDYPHVIEYKTAQLTGEKPNCQLQHIAADITQDTARRQLFADLGSRTKNALIITEGVIGYLTNDAAAALSRDLLAVPTFRYWIQDCSSGKRRRHQRARDLAKHLQYAPLQFTIDHPIPWFTGHGWNLHEKLHIMDEADRVHRAFPPLFPWNILLRLFPKQIKNFGNKMYAFVRFTR